MEEQVQHSSTNCQMMVLLQRHYYNGKTLKMVLKLSRCICVILESLVLLILYQRRRPVVLIRSSWVSLHFPVSFAVSLGSMAKFSPKECGQKNDVSPFQIVGFPNNMSKVILQLVFFPCYDYLGGHIFQIT